MLFQANPPQYRSIAGDVRGQAQSLLSYGAVSNMYFYFFNIILRHLRIAE